MLLRRGRPGTRGRIISTASSLSLGPLPPRGCAASTRPKSVTLIYRIWLLSGVVHSLGNLEAVTAADVGRGRVLVGVPKVLAGAAPDLDHVLEALGGDHSRPREAAR